MKVKNGGCQLSSSGPLPSQQCSPLVWFQRTYNLHCMDGHLLKLKCKYSNILNITLHKEVKSQRVITERGVYSRSAVSKHIKCKVDWKEEIK